jgi:plasmid stability protein
MKATFDLPDSLVKEVKLRALHQGRKLKDEVTNLLRAGLAAAERPPAPRRHLKSSRVKTDLKTGLPVIVCGSDAPATRMTAQALVQAEQDTQTQEDRERFGLSD